MKNFKGGFWNYPKRKIQTTKDQPRRSKKKKSLSLSDKESEIVKNFKGGFWNYPKRK